MLGQKLRSFLEAKVLLLNKMAGELELKTADHSKIDSNENLTSHQVLNEIDAAWYFNGRITYFLSGDITLIQRMAKHWL